jgi:hypothetical protein
MSGRVRGWSPPGEGAEGWWLKPKAVSKSETTCQDETVDDDIRGPGTEQARADLRRIEAVTGRVRAEADWIPGYLAFFAVAFGGVTLLLGLLQPAWVRMLAFPVIWPVVVLTAVLRVRRRAAAPRAAGRRMAPYWITAMIFYAIALVAGTPGRLGQVAYWVPAAVIVAAPFAVGAVRERGA